MTTMTHELTDDKILPIEEVLAAQAGDREAFGRLVERFERNVCATALRRLGNYVDAQEVTQEGFVQALRKIHQLREPVCFVAKFAMPFNEVTPPHQKLTSTEAQVPGLKSWLKWPSNEPMGCWVCGSGVGTE